DLLVHRLRIRGLRDCGWIRLLGEQRPRGEGVQRVAEIDRRRSAVKVRATPRDEEPDDRPRDEADGDEPPTPREHPPVPREVDLLLGFGVEALSGGRGRGPEGRAK